MQWISVSSTRMAAVAHNNQTKIMYIRFHDEAVWYYADVNETQFKAFMSSPSLGRALNSFQRGRRYGRT